MRKCENCGKDVGKWRHVYCSDECRIAVKIQKNRKKRYCDICGEELQRSIQRCRKCYAKPQIFIKNYKQNKKCQICGYDKCSAALELHHKDKNKKEFEFSDVMQYVKITDIEKEIKRCSLVCANCHREIHNPPSPKTPAKFEKKTPNST